MTREQHGILAVTANPEALSKGNTMLKHAAIVFLLAIFQAGCTPFDKNLHADSQPQGEHTLLVRLLYDPTHLHAITLDDLYVHFHKNDNTHQRRPEFSALDKSTFRHLRGLVGYHGVRKVGGRDIEVSAQDTLQSMLSRLSLSLDE